MCTCKRCAACAKRVCCKRSAKRTKLTRDKSPEGDHERADAQQQLETQDIVSQNVQLDLDDFCHTKRERRFSFVDHVTTNPGKKAKKCSTMRLPLSPKGKRRPVHEEERTHVNSIASTSFRAYIWPCVGETTPTGGGKTKSNKQKVGKVPCRYNGVLQFTFRVAHLVLELPDVGGKKLHLSPRREERWTTRQELNDVSPGYALSKREKHVQHCNRPRPAAT